ncbi:MAG: PstS family phosphate ABC transporter substrate-binding protein [Prevotella sp.]|jgi:phosphate transport system substrate-binding protein
MANNKNTFFKQNHLFRNSRIVSLTLAALLLLSCGSREKQVKNSSGLNGNISISGAFALYPLATQWAIEFQRLHPDVVIDLSAGGSGKGITDVLTGQVDLGMVSRGLKPVEKANGAVPIPVAKDAVVITMNRDNPMRTYVKRHGLSMAKATRLWRTEQVKTWGQLLGTKSTLPINVYTRSDACGAAATFAQWLCCSQEDLLGTGVYGDPGMAQQVGADVCGIGINNIGYVYNSKTGQPNKGLTVVPLDINGNGRVDNDEQFYDTKQQLINAIAAGRYPTPPARYLYFVTKGKPTNPVVRAFLEFVITRGQQYNMPAGFIPMNSSIMKKQMLWLKKTH